VKLGSVPSGGAGSPTGPHHQGPHTRASLSAAQNTVMYKVDASAGGSSTEHAVSTPPRWHAVAPCRIHLAAMHACRTTRKYCDVEDEQPRRARLARRARAQVLNCSQSATLYFILYESQLAANLRRAIEMPCRRSECPVTVEWLHASRAAPAYVAAGGEAPKQAPACLLLREKRWRGSRRDARPREPRRHGASLVASAAACCR